MTPSETRPSPDPDTTRHRLVLAALELFTTRGYHASTTPRIAARAGVAEGTIYRHFQSKEHLFNEIYRAGLRRFASGLGEVGTNRSCADGLAELATVWHRLAEENPALAHLVFSRNPGDPLDDRSREAREQFQAGVEQLIARGKAAGEIRSGSATTLAAIWTRLISLSVERVAGGEWRTGDEAVRQVISSAWDAVRAEAGQGRGNR